MSGLWTLIYLHLKVSKVRVCEAEHVNNHTLNLINIAVFSIDQ
jgi:hypothetical protein